MSCQVSCRDWLWISFAMLALPVQTLVAQPVDGKVQPDRLNFGTVRRSATVEGSVRIFLEGDDTTGLSVKVIPPPFVTVKRTDLGTQSFGDDTKIVCDVTVVLNTREVGEHDEAMIVEIDLPMQWARTVTVPITVQVAPADPNASSLLVVQTPFEKFSTDDASLFQPWIQLVELANINAHYIEVERGADVTRRLELSEFDVILLGSDGIVFATDKDVNRLKKFVHAGGKLIVAANAFYGRSVPQANKILGIAGLRMEDMEPRSGKLIAMAKDEIADDPLTKDVRVVHCYRPSPISVTDTEKARNLVSAPTYPGQGFVAVGQHGKGTVTAVGQSLWWNWIGAQRYRDSDNKRLMLNIVAQRASRD